MSFLKKNLNKIVVIGVAGVAVLVAGIAMLSSFIDYQNYCAKYDKEAAELKGKYAALPEQVFIDNDFATYSDSENVDSTKSAYNNSLIFTARDASVVPLSKTKAQEYISIEDDAFDEAISGLDRMGGAISFTVNVDEHSMSDIEICMMTNWHDGSGTYYGLENITDYIKIQINKLNVQTEDLELSDDRDEFTHLVLKDTNLVTGENVLTITTSAYNDKDNKNDFLYVMPNIRNVTFFSNAGMEKLVEEAE